jgi:hypothetical protein
VKANFRLGVKISAVFPNIAVFVFQVEPDAGDKIIKSMNSIRRLLCLSGNEAIAEKIICEFRN